MLIIFHVLFFNVRAGKVNTGWMSGMSEVHKKFGISFFRGTIGLDWIAICLLGLIVGTHIIIH